LLGGTVLGRGGICVLAWAKERGAVDDGLAIETDRGRGGHRVVRKVQVGRRQRLGAARLRAVENAGLIQFCPVPAALPDRPEVAGGGARPRTDGDRSIPRVDALVRE